MYRWIAVHLLSAIRWGELWTEMRDLGMRGDARRVAFTMRRSWKDYRECRDYLIGKRLLNEQKEA